MTGWRSPLVFALCVCGALAPAAARGEPDYGAEYTACVARAGGNMPAMMECTKAAWARWDKRLNETFKKVTERVGKDRQAQPSRRNGYGSNIGTPIAASTTTRRAGRPRTSRPTPACCG